MCELFGINSRHKEEINEWLKIFYSHSSQHPHGWGLACMEGNGAEIEKEPLQASKSHYLKERLTLPIDTKNAFAHIRYATIGNVEYRNCHPYSIKDQSGRRWTLIHNGTIFHYTPLDIYVKKQKGDTDSERILLYLVDCINRKSAETGNPLNRKERFAVLDEMICGMAHGNKLNLLIYDGELMYVHTNYADSLYYNQSGGRVLFSTSALDQKEWKLVLFNTLLAYQDGERVMKGTNHGQEYIENEENVQLLYRVFADL